MASWKPRIVKPEEPVRSEDGLLVYRYGRWSNLVAAQRGDRPRLVKAGEKPSDHWCHESGAELARKGPRVVTVDLEATGETQLAGGGLPDPRRK